MDTPNLISLLQGGLDDGRIGRRDRPFVETNLPLLRAGTILEDDRTELVAIAEALNLPEATPPPRYAGDHIEGNQYIYYGIAPTDIPALLKAYCQHLILDCTRLPLADIAELDPAQRQMLLDDIYTQLEVVGLDDSRDFTQRRRQNPPTALQAVCREQRLVLLGAPGSGKSTFVNHLGLVLARGQVHNTAPEADLGSEWVLGPRLPIRVILRTFAEWLQSQPDVHEHASRWLWTYLADHDGLPQPLVDALMERLYGGTALLLLDGLDEVPVAMLPRVLAAIAPLNSVASAAILVTCRVLDYGHPERQLAGWSVATLSPFSPELQQTFIARWFTTMRRIGRLNHPNPQALQQTLSAQIRARPELRRLAGNPLLLTMMAQLQAFKHRLPDDRATLYKECIEFLLYQWRPRTPEESLPAVLTLPTWGERETLDLLDRLAYMTHLHGTLPPDGEAGADLDHARLIQTAATYFMAFDAAQRYARAEAFCRFVAQYSNGVLQQVDQDTFRFPHRTFQEYLAARRLVNDESWPPEQGSMIQRLLAVADQAAWHEVLLLAATMARPAEIVLLAQALLTAQVPARTVLAGEILAEVGQARLRMLGDYALTMWNETVAALAALLDMPAAPTSERIRGGFVLGVLSDPRPGVCTLEPDWCEVPGGVYTLGSAEDDADARGNEKPVYTVELAAFSISRYPVTNAQWQRFMDAGGYTNRDWWLVGWEVRQERGWTAPEEWENPRFNGPNQPVVGVSWYEARAYCTWLAAELGYAVRLPTEAEWEVAARGTDRRVYPWGNGWDAAWANTTEEGPGRTTAVGSYPEGASPWGVLDMSGNVWEWTGSAYEAEDRNAGMIDINNETYVSVRGGAWGHHHQLARCAYRFGATPALRGDFQGVRVARPSLCKTDE